MTVQEFFYLTASVALWLLVIINLIIGYYLIKTLQIIRHSLKTYNQIKRDVSILGNAAKIGFLEIFSKILGRISKGGELYG